MTDIIILILFIVYYISTLWLAYYENYYRDKFIDLLIDLELADWQDIVLIVLYSIVLLAISPIVMGSYYLNGKRNEK